MTIKYDTIEEELIDKHLDEFYQWVGDNKYSEAMDWSPQYHGDDDHEEILENYINDNPQLIHEYIKQLPDV